MDWHTIAIIVLLALIGILAVAIIMLASRGNDLDHEVTKLRHDLQKLGHDSADWADKVNGQLADQTKVMHRISTVVNKTSGNMTRFADRLVFLEKAANPTEAKTPAKGSQTKRLKPKPKPKAETNDESNSTGPSGDGGSAVPPTADS